ncbi:hypothetical protein A6V39_01670 [Candidatus Mycoplasma haematobovis]|uniref:Uncharacterized protein n=1 Tax=Candidatus Mycoplasma haematobovis TaxID=432608 RepID=A0A1A9QFG5_9MOLU|nr:hypothetical protein [Candidatus Mycoplasma haematobovis]OAL10751.1 hypothetical protein A6V39_01670 [Candidatus Mycoplasma haematobovis]
MPKKGLGFDDNWRIPKWENIEVWKKLYSKEGGKKINIGGWGTENTKILSGPEELRDVCYEMVTKESLENCSSSSGWCESCLIDKSWLPIWNVKD